MDILFEDKDILVINKPAGLAVQTNKLGEKCLETEYKKYRKAKGEEPVIFVVHRLDQPVSGIMVLAKNEKAASALSKSMQQNDFTKKYRAEAFKGSKIEKSGRVTNYLFKDSKTNSSRVVNKGINGAKEAILDYVITKETESTVSLDITLKTGRHHQIRVQFSNLGCPLLGDQKYGTEESIAYSRDNQIKNVALTSCNLEFIHPVSKEKMSFSI